MGYSEAFINRTKAQLLEHNRKLSREIAALNKEHDIQVESYRKVVEENKTLRGDLAAKEESNKKLADQFYEYREKLVGMSHELEGVRGALKREAEMRVESKKKCDELCEKLVKMGNEFEAYRKSFNDKDIECDKYRQEMVKWKNEAGDYRTRWDNACIENELLRNELNEVGKIQLKHNTLTLESLDNALKQWDYIDGKLSRDLCMPLESLIQLLDEYGVNDFCKLRERLMYGPTTDYSNALANVRTLEKENATLKALSDDLEKQRRELEQKLAQERNVSMVQEARATDLERQLRRKTGACSDWMDRTFRVEEELRKVKDHDRIAQENFEKAARKNDELQDRVNILEQRWTDTFNPEDELLGRKVLEWQDINVTLAKHNIENSMVLGAELDMLKEYRKVLDKHGIMGAPYLDESLKRLERFQQMLRDWHFQMIDEFSTYVNGLHNYKIICEQNLIGSTDELKKSLDELKTFRLSPFRSLGTEWRDVVEKYHVASPDELDKCLNQRQRMHHTLHALKKDIEQFNQP